MRSSAYSAWRPQRPSADFAQRTVEAILRDRNAGSRAVRPRRTEPLVAGALGSGSIRSRRMSAFAVACLLLIAGAWGAWAGLPRTGRKAGPQPEVVPIDVTRTNQPFLRTPSVSVHMIDPPRQLPAPAKLQAKVPQHKEMAPADGARPVNLPRCGCDPEICDCVEPQ
jgi:hypothetical protein